MRRSDTIVAAATPPGRGGVGIVRISGPKVPELAAVMLGELPKARHATFARFLDAQQDAIDAGLALFFPAPHSYTGEHVLELHGHGGPLVVEAVVARVVELGARRAPRTGGRTPGGRGSAAGWRARTRRSCRRFPAPRAMWCARGSTWTACRCTCSIPRACAAVATSSRRRACGARGPRCSAPTGCCS